MAAVFSDQGRIEAARRIIEHLAAVVDLPVAVRLWDGTRVALGQDADEAPTIAVSGPGVLGAFLRRPSLDTLFRHYVRGGIELHGGDLIETFELARSKRKAAKLGFGDLVRGFPWSAALPLAFARDHPGRVDHEIKDDDSGRQRARLGDQDLIRFHYDVGNAFYGLFLDPEMVYSCGYFTDWSNSLEQAQSDKLDMICRKLRLQAGERFLDIGSGWGALLCHAAGHYGVRAQGVTLSQAQYDFARDKIDRLGLRARVSVTLGDYRALAGSYDKIASIGMYEHVGIANYRAYFRKIHGLLTERGAVLNHGITRRAKKNVKNFGKVSAGKRVILKYIFPGSELDHIGHTLQVMESCGFEVHDVEGLRAHYGRTCRLWHDRLLARREDAVALAGPERTRMWLAYLAGVTVGFEHGPLRIYQTLATKQSAQADPPLPPTRADLYVTHGGRG
jgi:cyclopropane-fatty-acyl-phospholipid synthase